MNDHKFCFIICANNETYLRECEWYIEQLCVPAGYETEVVVIRGAVSMAAGYNEAMKRSDAKYKIYLHQDVFLICPDMISELLRVFEESTIGMVGVLGNQELLPGADYTLKWDCGSLYMSDLLSTQSINNIKDDGKGYVDVVCADGAFLATQVDLPWDEETFDGWDFYDISQSVRFHQAGYRVVVPKPSTDMWLVHDAGKCTYLEWERYRKVFCESYAGLGYQYAPVNVRESYEKQAEVGRQVLEAVERREFDRLGELTELLDTVEVQDSRMCYAVLYLRIGRAEREIGQNLRVKDMNLREFTEYYDEIRFLMRRAEYGQTDMYLNQLRERFNAGEITMPMLWTVMEGSLNLLLKKLRWEILSMLTDRIRSVLARGEIGTVVSIYSVMPEGVIANKAELSVLLDLLNIFQQEMAHQVAATVFDYSLDLDELVQHFFRLKLYMRRMEFNLPVEYQREFYDYCVATGVSDYFILQLLQKNLFLKKDACLNLSARYAEREGVGSMRASLYAQLAQTVG